MRSAGHKTITRTIKVLEPAPDSFPCIYGALQSIPRLKALGKLSPVPPGSLAAGPWPPPCALRILTEFRMLTGARLPIFCSERASLTAGAVLIHAEASQPGTDPASWFSNVDMAHSTH
jgi:hypothetical protein